MIIIIFYKTHYIKNLEVIKVNLIMLLINNFKNAIMI